MRFDWMFFLVCSTDELGSPYVGQAVFKSKDIWWGSAEFAICMAMFRHNYKTRFKPPMFSLWTVPRQYFWCSLLVLFLFVCSAFNEFLLRVLFHVIKPLSGALGGLCCMAVAFPGYLHINFLCPSLLKAPVGHIAFWSSWCCVRTCMRMSQMFKFTFKFTLTFMSAFLLKVIWLSFMLGSWNLVCHLPRPKPSTMC